LADLLSAVDSLHNLVIVQGHKGGVVGFCAGGGTWQGKRI
jgi:dienelactone hydrolase